MFIYVNKIFSERRQAEAARIREKYPDRIPVLFMKYVFTFLIYKFAFI